MEGSSGQPCASCLVWRVALGAALLALIVTLLVVSIW
jgi:hypothetical protein